MKNYEKPIVLANDELAEGIYAASGAVNEGSSSSGTDAVSVSKVTLASEGNWDGVRTYNVTITNSGSENLTEWSASISVTSGTATNVTIYNNWLASATLNGNKITITPGGGGTIEAEKSIDVSVVVWYSGDSITVQ